MQIKVEEAIEVVKAHRDRLNNSVSNLLDKDIEAFNIAIAAMEKGPEYLERINHQMQYISKLEGFIKMNIPEWNLMQERLPDERQKVLLQYHQFNNDNNIQYAVTYRYNNVNWYKLSNIVPIQWMIFPEPYIEASRQQDKGEQI